MKRASLSVKPAPPKAAPADLTDRLLDREAERAAQPASPAPQPKRRRAPQARPAAPAGTNEPQAQPPVLEASAPDDGASLHAALSQAAGAADALEAAARQAPARYEVALRYRLDALAHHLRQVADFVGSLARR